MLNEMDSKSKYHISHDGTGQCWQCSNSKNRIRSILCTNCSHVWNEKNVLIICELCNSQFLNLTYFSISCHKFIQKWKKLTN